MQIKPLEWLGGGDRHHAADFAIYKLDGHRRTIWRLVQADLGTQYRGDFGGANGLQRAKETAQLMHERRIHQWVEASESMEAKE